MTKSTETIRWGIIGCGDVTEKKSGPAYQKTKGFTLQAVMRREFKKAKDYAARHKVPQVFETADELIASPQIDAVYIATPPDSHKDYALAVAAAGKPCCIEKPMAPRHRDCLEILEAFDKARQTVFVAYYRRALPRFLKVKEWLDSGKIGTPRQVNWHLTKFATETDLAKTYNWRTDAAIGAGGYFDDLASHGLDLFNYLLGDIDSVHGLATNQQNLYTAKDALSACWIHENGVTGTGSWNFGCHDEGDTVELRGSAGKIEFSVFQEKPISYTRNNGASESLEIPHPENVQLHHVQAMRDHLAGSRTHPSLGQNAAHASWILDQILGHHR